MNSGQATCFVGSQQCGYNTYSQFYPSLAPTAKMIGVLEELVDPEEFVLSRQPVYMPPRPAVVVIKI